MPPSSNWLSLKKNLSNGSSRPAKRRRVDDTTSEAPSVIADPELESIPTDSLNRDTSNSLQQMVYGQNYYPSPHLLPGKYVAIDCEMVGIAGDPSKKSLAKGDESSLARVSVVNYYGAVQLDAFVRQREHVTDWRTAVSGVRESDMVNAKSFSEVQKLVADLLKNRILVGHAVHNDLKALLLSHPHNMTRDTQMLAGRHGTLSTSTSDTGTAAAKVSVNRKPALRKLVIQELGIDIQAGEHSSVTDARATMAIYRLHRRTWDKGSQGRTAARQSTMSLDRVLSEELLLTTSQERQKRSRADQSSKSDDDAEDNTPRKPVGTHKQRHSVKQKGTSSGLSVVIKRRKNVTEMKQIVSRSWGNENNKERKDKWWGTLGN